MVASGVDTGATRAHNRTMTESSKATETATIARCAGCGRKLTSAQSIARGFGPTCYRRISAATKAIALVTKPKAMEAATEILRKGMIRKIEADVYSVLSSDMHTTYYVDHGVCGCPAGSHGRQCKHVVARDVMELVR